MDIETKRNDLPPYEQASYLHLVQIPCVNGKLEGFHLNKLQLTMSYIVTFQKHITENRDPM